MELAQITQFQNFYSENLLSKKSLLKDNPTLNYSGDGVGSITDVNAYSLKSKAILINEPFSPSNSISATFDIGNALEFTTPYSGSHIFQFSFMSQTAFDSLFNAKITLKVFINSTLTYTFESTYNFYTQFVNGNFYTFCQSFNLAEDDIVNFSFEITSTSTITQTSSLQLYFSGFKCEFDNKQIFTPTPYSLPNQNLMNWQSRVDTTNTQNILADTETNFGFVGTSESNDNVTLITTSGLITPIYQNDVVSIDYYFDFVSASASDKFVDILIKVNSIIYRAETFILSKAIGETEFVSGSFRLPVGADFKQYGAQIVIKSSEAITIKNRYINAIETTNI